MSYYHKYRPQTLDEVRGNSEIVSSLIKYFETDTVPHAILLHGGTGCGKTTIGRIIGNMLECDGQDFREVDSADFRGIDTIREIRKNSQFKPLESNCRVWMLDECHKLSNDAQNALLKILEDTPPHVYFILCTTEPTKLISTVRGRCQQFEVKPLTDKQMFTLLRSVVTGEDETLDRPVYDLIISNSNGHPRNAIQLLELVLQAEPEQRLATANKVQEQTTQVIDLCRALLSNHAKWRDVAGILEGLKGMEPETIRRTVIGYAQAVLLKGENNTAAAMIEAFWEPMYDILFPGVVFCCYKIVMGK